MTSIELLWAFSEVITGELATVRGFEITAHVHGEFSASMLQQFDIWGYRTRQTPPAFFRLNLDVKAEIGKYLSRFPSLAICQDASPKAAKQTKFTR